MALIFLKLRHWILDLYENLHTGSDMFTTVIQLSSDPKIIAAWHNDASAFTRPPDAFVSSKKLSPCRGVQPETTPNFCGSLIFSIRFPVTCEPYFVMPRDPEFDCVAAQC